MSYSTKKNLIRKYLMHEHKIALLLVAMIGIVGSTYVLSSINNADIDPNHAIIHIEQENTNNSMPLIRVAGRKISKNPLQFSISNYNPELDYTIDFGDGNSQLLTLADFTHTYKREGIYDVALSVIFTTSQSIVKELSLNIEKTSAQISKP